MHLITHILNRAIIPHNQRLIKRRFLTPPLRVNAHEIQFFPAALDDVLDPEVELAGHDGCVGFVGESVQVVERDGVDFVVDVETVRSVLGFWVEGGCGGIGGGGLTILCICGGLS